MLYNPVRALINWPCNEADLVSLNPNYGSSLSMTATCLANYAERQRHSMALSKSITARQLEQRLLTCCGYLWTTACVSHAHPSTCATRRETTIVPPDVS